MSEGHAKLPPSGAHRWMRCPGSIALCADLPERDSVYSREGTFAHDVAANVLLKDLDRVAEMIGHSDGEFTVDADMARHLQIYVSAVRTQQLLTQGTLQVEQRVELHPLVWGTADALVWSPGMLDVFDLKYGQGILVSPEENEQEKIYALGALITFHKLAEQFGVRQVTLHIVQPRRADNDGELHRQWVISRQDLESWYLNELGRAFNATQDEDAPLIPGDHCTFCDAKSTCPKLAEAAMESAVEVFTNVDPTATKIQPPVPQDLTPRQLSFAIENAAIVELWLKAVVRYAEDRARAGVKIPGFKLVNTVGNRQWKDPELAAKILANHGVDPYEKKLLSPAKAEKALGRGGKPTVDPLTTRPDTGTKLVPETDNRPAIAGGEVFDEIS